MNAHNRSVLVVGTGEYVTGLGSDLSGVESDKKKGVIALCLFDLRARGFFERLLIATRNGKRFPAIRKHFQYAIVDVYAGLRGDFESYPADDAEDPQAYIAAMQTLQPGDAVIINTPDHLHYEMVTAALERDLHVLCAKPLVFTLAEHYELLNLAAARKRLLLLELHKRYDPVYVDARDRIRELGDFTFMQSYMSQPAKQLETFKQWAADHTDISYYLNSHHIDFHVWSQEDRARPVTVVAMGSNGVAREYLQSEVADSISLTVEWENLNTGTHGVASYTASWIAPESDAHSQQRFFYQAHKGELQVDQARRGYQVATEADGFRSMNPLYMKYTPSEGRFSGQGGYGYRSIELFLETVNQLNAGKAKLEECDTRLPTARATLQMTAILEAGRVSLDHGGRRVDIQYDDADLNEPPKSGPKDRKASAGTRPIKLKLRADV